MSRYKLKWGIICLFAILILFSYGNQLIYRYAVPAGGDAYGHLRIANIILHGDYAQIYQYHTVWHLIVVALTLITRVPAITVMAWLAPLLLVTMGISLYIFNRRYFGEIAGVTSLILIGFFSNQPIQTLYDGSFPNVLAAGTILPLFMIALVSVYRTNQKLKRYLILGIMAIILVYSHHLTTLYTIPVVILFFLAELVKIYREKGTSLWKIFLVMILALISILILFALLLNSSAAGSVNDLAKQFLDINFVFPFIHFKGYLDNPNAYLALTDYPNALGEAVVFLGIGGFLVALYHVIFRSQESNWPAYLVLVLWAYCLLISSQILSVGFPIRFARDLVIPLALLGGVFVSHIILLIRNRTFPRILTVLFVIACLGVGSLTFISRIKRIFEHNPLIYHLRVDSAAAEYITTQLPLRAKITVFQDDIYLNSFTPLHNVEWDGEYLLAQKLVQPDPTVNLIQATDYIYLEERYDRDESWINNHGIIEAYSAASFVKLVATFEQPEKKVYVFQVLHSAIKNTRDND